MMPTGMSRSPTASLALPARAFVASLALHAAVATWALAGAPVHTARAQWSDSAAAPPSTLSVSFREAAAAPAEVGADLPPWDRAPELPPTPVPPLEWTLPSAADGPPPPPSMLGAGAIPPREPESPAARPWLTLPAVRAHRASHAAAPASAPAANEVPPVAARDASSGAPSFVAASAERGRNRGPTYPEQARRLGQQGVVTLLLDVDASGAVTAAEVLVSSGHRLLDAEALRCVSAWRFEPARRDGSPVASRVEQQVGFELRAR
jgi:protein TonB